MRQYVTLMEIFSLCLVILISRVLAFRFLITVPFVFIILLSELDLLIVHRRNFLRRFPNPRIIHVLLLRILQSLISLLQQLKLLHCLFRLVMIRMILPCYITLSLPLAR